MEHIPVKLNKKSENLSKNIVLKYLRFTRVFGLMPMGGQLAVSLWWYTSSCLSLSAFLSFIVYYKIGLLNDSDEGLFGLLRDAVSITEEIFVIGAHMLSLGFRYAVFNELLEGIEKLNVKPEVTMKRTLAWSVVVFSLSIGTCYSLTRMTSSQNFEELVDILSFIFVKECGFFILAFVLFQFLFILEYLTSCLRTLVRRLQPNSYSLINNFVLFENVVKLMKLCNALYSFQLLYLSWRMFAVLLFICYNFTQMNENQRLNERLYTMLAVALREVTLLISLTSSCTDAVSVVRPSYIYKFILQRFLFENVYYLKNGCVGMCMSHRRKQSFLRFSVQTQNGGISVSLIFLSEITLIEYVIFP